MAPSRRRRTHAASDRSAGAWPWLLGLAAVAALAGIGSLVWSRTAPGQAALLNLGAEKLYGEVQANLDAALGAVLPDLAAAGQAPDAHEWPLPEAGPAAHVRCLVVPVESLAAWWQVQHQVAEVLREAGGRVLWAERLARSSQRRDQQKPQEDRDLLRLDVGVSGRPTHTLLLYRQAAGRPQVSWGADPASAAWRQLVALAESGAPIVAVVIDDWGYRQDAATTGLLALGAPLTMAVLPGLPYSRRFALEATDLALPAGDAGGDRGFNAEAAALRRQAACPVTLGLGTGLQRLDARRREVFLHLPMQPDGYPRVDPGPRAILVGMSRAQIAGLLDEALLGLPHVRGVNNHMGSAATADEPTMQALMAELKARDLVFLDSLTSASSVAYRTARATGLAAARNRVFLDHDHQDHASVRRSLGTLAASARSGGFAVAIGHPHPATMEVLRQEVPRLQAEGVVFVTLSELLALQEAVAGKK